MLGIRQITVLALVWSMVAPAALAQPSGSAEPRIRFDDQAHVVGPNGTVSTIEVRAATANESFYVAVAHPGGPVLNRSQTFPAGALVEQLRVELAPPLNGSTDLVASVRNASTGTALASDDARVELEPRRGAIRVADQARPGSDGVGVRTLVVEAATASVPHRVEVHGPEGERVNRTGVFPAHTVHERLVLELTPPIHETTQLHTRIVDVGTGEVFDTANATLTVQPVDARIRFDDQAVPPNGEGRAETVTVQLAQANVEFHVAVHQDGLDHPLVSSPRFPAGTQTNVTLALHPPVEGSQTLTAAVHHPTGARLAEDAAAVTIREPDPGPPSEASGLPGPGVVELLVATALAGWLAVAVGRRR